MPVCNSGETVRGRRLQLWRARPGRRNRSNRAGEYAGHESVIWLYRERHPPGFAATSNSLATQVTSAEYEQLLTQGFQPTNPYLQTPQETPTQTFAQHGMHMLPSQMSAPEPTYSLEQPMYPSQISRHMSQAVSVQPSLSSWMSR